MRAAVFTTDGSGQTNDFRSWPCLAAGDRADLANGLVRLGTTCLALGQAGEAQAALEECVALCEALGVSSSAFIAAIGFLGVANMGGCMSRCAPRASARLA